MYDLQIPIQYCLHDIKPKAYLRNRVFVTDNNPRLETCLSDDSLPFIY